MLKPPQPASKKLLAKNIEDYFLDEIGTHSQLNKLEYESQDYTPAIELLRYRQEIFCLDAMLDKERLKHGIKQEEFKQRWKSAARQMKETDEAIVSLDERYKEALDDKARQLQIAARQDDLRIGKEQDIRRLKKEHTILKEVRNQTSERLQQFKPVKKYLERVRDMSQGEFRTIRELLERFNLLKDTRDTLVDRENTVNELIVRRQNLLDGLTAVKGNEAVLLNNYIFELTEELENLISKEQHLEEELATIKTTAAKRTMTLSKVRLATYNLYRQACKMMSRNATIPPVETLRQLNYIRGSLIEINRLRRRLQNIMRKAIAAHKAEVREKAKADRLEQQRSRFAQKSERRRDLAAAFGFKAGEVTHIQEQDQDKQFSNFGRTAPIWESLSKPKPVTPAGGRDGKGTQPPDESTREGREGGSHRGQPKGTVLGGKNLMAGGVKTQSLIGHSFNSNRGTP